MTEPVANPLAPEQALKRPLEGGQLEEGHPRQPILPEDSAVTKAEKVERNGVNAGEHKLKSEEPAAKRVKLNLPEMETFTNLCHQSPEGYTPGPLAQLNAEPETETLQTYQREKVKGIALVKPE
jgi:tRNA-dihydrouridine synthase 3